MYLKPAAIAVATAAALAAAPAAFAASKVESSGSAITFTGDPTAPTTATISPVNTEADGDHVFRIEPAGAVSGPACAAQDGGAICNDNASSGTARTLTVTTGAGADVVTTTAPVGATYQLGDGDDQLHLAPSAPVTNTVDGGRGSDLFDIGRSFGPDKVGSSTSDPSDVDLADYLARQTGGVTVTSRLLQAPNDGAPGEQDDIGTIAVRGTVNADALNAPIMDGDLGADSFETPPIGAEGAGFVVDYAFPTPAGYTPVSSPRALGVVADAAAGTSSDGDTFAGRVDKLRGTALADDLRVGIGGTISGRGGDDTLRAGARDATYDGGAGSDTVSYAGFEHGVTATLGDPGVLTPADQSSEVERIVDVENLVGSAFDDTLRGSNGANAIDGGAGKDTFDAGNLASGQVIDLRGSSGNDQLSGIEVAHGSPLDDRMIGTDGADQLFGGGGEDKLQGLGGADLLFGEAGEDTLTYEERTAGETIDVGGAHPDGDLVDLFERTCGTQGNDVITSAGQDTLIGLGGSDQLHGGSGPDLMFGDDAAAICAAGEPGNDTLTGAGGNDDMHGGAGVDTASYSDHPAGVKIAIQGAQPTFANTDADVVRDDVENLLGSTGNDVLLGSGGPNKLLGSAGNDIIDGNAGDDTLDGGAGNDLIGPFTFTFAGGFTATRESAPTPDGVDTIIGGPGEDDLDSRDGLTDAVVVCDSGGRFGVTGAGTNDIARIDLKDPAAAVDCETAQRAQVDMFPTADVRGKWVITKESVVTKENDVTASAARARARTVKLRVSCPRVAVKLIGPKCRGRLVIHASRSGRTLGSARYSVKQGHRGTVWVRIRGALTARAVAQLTERQTNGNLRTVTQVRDARPPVYRAKVAAA